MEYPVVKICWPVPLSIWFGENPGSISVCSLCVYPPSPRLHAQPIRNISTVTTLNYSLLVLHSYTQTHTLTHGHTNKC